MAINQVSPNERFTLTKIFDPSQHRFTADQPAVEETINHERTYFTCARCGEVVRFSMEDFAGVKNVTLLSHEDAEEFSLAEKNLGLSGQDFRDLYCPDCRRPIRIYFRYMYSNASSCELKSVLEKA